MRLDSPRNVGWTHACRFCLRFHHALLVLLLLAAPMVSSTARAQQTAPPKAKTKKINTFSDMLDRLGVKNANERKYIEDTVKQDLQDEISKHVDLGLDVEVYLKSLNHLVNGEIKQANTYLGEEIGKKVLEWAVGSGAAAVLTAAWDFDKYVWTSVQKWAEEKDRQKFHNFLKDRVNAWRNGRDLHEMQTGRGARTRFDLWWHDNMEQFGKTKMYGDRQNYYVDFENACRHRYMDVASKCREALAQQENLRLAVRDKLWVLQMKIANQRSGYMTALRRLRRAGLTGTEDEIKLYRTDEAFQAKVAELIEKNGNKSTLEVQKSVLTSAEADLAASGDAANKAATAQEAGRLQIVEPPLARLATFESEYRTILQLLFSNSVDATEGIAALQRCEGLNISFCGGIYRTRECIRRMPAKNAAQSKQVQAAVARIDKALRHHGAAMIAIRKSYEPQGKAALESLRSPDKRLQEIDAEKLHYDVYWTVSNDLWAKAPKVPGEIAKVKLDAPLAPNEKKNADGLTRAMAGLARGVQTSQYRTTPSPSTCGYINPAVPDPLGRMDRAEDWLSAAIYAYAECMDEHIKKLDAARIADESMLDRYRSALARFASQYESNAGAIAFAGKYCRVDFELGSNLIGWQYKYAQKEAGLYKNAGKAYKMVRFHYPRLGKMVAFQTGMHNHFEQERALLSQAQLLAADAAQLRQRYGDVQRTGDTQALDDVSGQAIAILRSGDRTAVYNEMIARYRAVLGRIDGTPAGYQRVLTPATKASHGLNKPPYQGFRRIPQLNQQILAAMAKMIELGKTASDDDRRYADALARCKKIDLQFAEIGRQSRLLGGEAYKLQQQAQRDTLAVRGALGTPKVLISDPDEATKLMDAFQTFAGQAAAFYAADDSRIGNYLAKARTQIATQSSDPAVRAKAASTAAELVYLADYHAQVMDAFAPYGGTFRHDAAIRKAKAEVGKFSSGNKLNRTADDIHDFPAGGNYHVAINGISSSTMRKWQANKIASTDGSIEIRTESYDPLFRNAKKVMIAIFTGPRPKRLTFTTVSRKGPDFVHRLKVPFDQPHTIEIQIVTDKLTGHTPLQYPLNFHWGQMPIGNVGKVKVIRIRKKGEWVSFSGKLGQALELKLTTGNATAPAELHVLGLADVSLYGQKPQAEYGMLRGKWVELTPYSRDPGASKKFTSHSTEEEEGKGLRFWEMQANIEPNEQYNVFQKFGNEWRLVAYVIGMNVKRPVPPQGGGQPPKRDYSAAVAKPLAEDKVFVPSLLQAVLDAAPDTQQVPQYLAQLNKGTPRQKAIMDLFNSVGYQNRRVTDRQFVRDAYQAIPGREPSAMEVSDLLLKLNQGTPRDTALKTLFNSTEYAQIQEKRKKGGGDPNTHTGGNTGGGNVGGGSVGGGNTGGEPVLSGLRVRAATRRARPNTTVTVPFHLEFPKVFSRTRDGRANVANLNVELAYDPSVVRPAGKVIKGNLMGGCIFQANASKPGVIKIGFATSGRVQTSGTLAQIPFQVVGQPGQASPLRVRITTINAEDGSAPKATVGHGLIQIQQKVVVGDFNGNGIVDASDALAALKMSLDLIPEDLILNVDKQGGVTSNDARLLLKMATKTMTVPAK